MSVGYEIKSPLHRIFLENIRNRRDELGLTQAEVAEKMGVSQPGYANIESGRNTPTIEIIERVASALDTGAIQLLIPQHLTAGKK